MAFFYDNCEYILFGVFGTGTTEVDCVNWEIMEFAAFQAKAIFIATLDGYILAASPCVNGEDCESVFIEKIYTDFYQGCYIDFLVKYSVFWNMMRCEENKITGILTESTDVPTIDGSTITIEYVVDYGDGSFDITIAEDYQTTEAEFMCCIQNIMVLVMDEQFEQSTMPEFNQITTTTTTIAPTTTTTTIAPTTTTTTIPCTNCVSGDITIGTQVWAKCNLDVTTYRNGDTIPEVTDPLAWTGLTTGAWCWYNNNSANGPTYGKLYNWYAVNDARGLAPYGYHIPTDAELTTLTDYLGGLTVAGGKMKEAGLCHWNSPNTDATNTSLFTGLPGGYRIIDGNYGAIGVFGYWWSSSEYNTSNAWFHQLYSYGGDAIRSHYNKKIGFSVRLVKD